MAIYEPIIAINRIIWYNNSRAARTRLCRRREYEKELAGDYLRFFSTTAAAAADASAAKTARDAASAVAGAEAGAFGVTSFRTSAREPISSATHLLPVVESVRKCVVPFPQSV